MPREFWRLTPAELAFLAGKSAIGVPLSHQELNELAAAFPDKTSEDGNG
ncbi:MAG: phage tail assembly chaperone [Boseongicola sp.]